MARYTSLRASDADREAVAERLRHAAVEGRLEPDELEQRLHTALRARTYGELNRLLVDLPAQRPRRQARPVPRVAFAVAVRVFVALAIVAAVAVAAALTIAWWLVGLVIWLAVSSSKHGCRGHVRRVTPRRL